MDELLLLLLLLMLRRRWSMEKEGGEGEKAMIYKG